MAPRNPGAPNALYSVFSWAVALCCVYFALSCDDARSSYFARSFGGTSGLTFEKTAVPSGLEFPCAARCSADETCETAAVVRGEGVFFSREYCTLKEGQNAFRGPATISLEKLGAFSFDERTFDSTKSGGDSCTRKSPSLGSCQQIHEGNKSATDGMYNITLTNGESTAVYCVMSDIPGCGGGGWTLVMKINGSQSFRFQSAVWDNKNTHNPAAASGGLDSQEFKSKAYWGVPITKGLCLGMKAGNGPSKYIRLPYSASSLHSVIADNKYRNTSLGLAVWKSLINGSHVHGSHDQSEGFNVNPGGPISARIGIASNASLPAGISILGFGLSWNEVSCGNFALVKSAGVSSRIHLTAFGSILIQ